ncbi:hypothetical protein I4U23_025717 [Adineta vaga]|nr:hypothetical protein I4U23_025717 [Adineta vaga]
MNSTDIIIPFDFPFAILENRYNPDSNYKRVYAVADGQYTYGPLSLFQYHNDEKYSKLIHHDQLPASLPCKEFYVVESGSSVADAIEIMDENRGQIYVKEIDPSKQNKMNALMQEVAECRNEIRSLKSVLSENRLTRQASLNASISTPIGNRKQMQSTYIKKNLNTPPSSRSQSVTTTRTLLKNVKSSGYGQQSSPAYATPRRLDRK